MVDFFKMLTGKTKEELIRPEIIALAKRGRVTWEEQSIPMNSYERDEVLPALTDDAFLRNLLHCASNVGFGASPGTYDFSIGRKYVPEALRRGLFVPLDKEPEFSRFGVSLPMAQVAALRRVLALVMEEAPPLTEHLEGEISAILCMVRLGELATEMFPLWQPKGELPVEEYAPSLARELEEVVANALEEHCPTLCRKCGAGNWINDRECRECGELWEPGQP